MSTWFANSIVIFIFSANSAPIMLTVANGSSAALYKGYLIIHFQQILKLMCAANDLLTVKVKNSESHTP